MGSMALVMEESKKIQLGVCEICGLSVTLWDENFGMLGVRYEGLLIVHDACQYGKLAVSL